MCLFPPHNVHSQGLFKDPSQEYGILVSCLHGHVKALCAQMDPLCDPVSPNHWGGEPDLTGSGYRLAPSFQEAVMHTWSFIWSIMPEMLGPCRCCLLISTCSNDSSSKHEFQGGACQENISSRVTYQGWPKTVHTVKVKVQFLLWGQPAVRFLKQLPTK